MTTRQVPLDQHDLLQKAERYFPGACLGMIVLPADLRMVMVRGQGSKVYDAAGNEYLDYMLGSGPLLLGHCRPEVVEAVQRQAALGSTYFALNEPAIRLAETIVEATPRRRGDSVSDHWKRGDGRGCAAGPRLHGPRQDAQIRGRLPERHGHQRARPGLSTGPVRSTMLEQSSFIALVGGWFGNQPFPPIIPGLCRRHSYT